MPKRRSREYDRFTKLIDRVIAVPQSVVRKRIDEHRAQSAQNPRKRGPKPKVTSSASDRGDDD